MVVQIRKDAKKTRVEDFIDWLKGMGLEVHVSVGMMQTVLGLVGDTTQVDLDLIRALDIVEDVKRIGEPYKNANRKFHPADTVLSVGRKEVGGGQFAYIAGPCSVESESQICAVASQVKKRGATLLRGGAFKPRTSPYAFQGLQGEGLRLLLLAKAQTGLPIVTELMDLSQLDLFAEVDVIQVGARNMQNYTLLRELGRSDKPILLKRGLSSTLEELLMSAEYIMAGGNDQVILCERGIRTFEPYTRNTMDLSAVPALKHLSHLPVVIDPSHGTGHAWMVRSMALAAAAAGADGVMIEVHNDPEHALCDGPQSLTPAEFGEVTAAIDRVRAAVQGPDRKGAIA